jgi:cytochrome c oxidase cbb3-type subunit 3
MTTNHWLTCGVAAALSLTLAGCTRDSSGVLATAAPYTAPSANRAVVGPIPGPDKRVVQVSNPFAGNKVAMGEGRQLFNRMNCSGCHGDHAGGGMGPSLRDVDWIYGNEDAQILSTIAEGRAHGMPAWGPKMGDDQIWKLVTYIKSLRTRNEPEAPEP